LREGEFMCGTLSWTLLVIGVLFIVLSLAGAFLEIVKDFRSAVSARTAGGKALAPDQLSDLLSKVTGLIDAVTKLISTLATSPRWLVLLIAGLAVAGYSHWMVATACS
jgi:hypothetical protein